MDIRLDDILAALLLSLAMFRRLEVMSAPPQPALGLKFGQWQKAAQRLYTRVALACAAKVIANLGFFHAAFALGIEGFAIPAVSALIFMSWVVFMVWSWRVATEINHRRLILGIVLRRPRRKPQPDGSAP